MTLLEEASARYAPVSSVCADFVQHLAVPLLDDERTARGRLCHARPNLFAMRFTEPAGGVVLVDGTYSWYYMPSSDPRQAFRAPVEQGTGGQDFHREFLENPRTKYTVTYEGEEQVGGAATHRLRLVPRTRTSYRAAVLWLEQGTSLLRQFRLEEENGNRRTVTLSDIQFDVAPPAGFFVFTPPRGVTIMDAPEVSRGR
jgi:chaperone LolA